MGPSLGSVLSIATLLFKAACGYDQNDETLYLANFANITSQSHSFVDDNNVPPGLVTNCVDQGKLSAPLVDVTIATSTTSSQVQALCGVETHCIIPQGVKVIMDSDLNVGALTLLDGGELEWKDSPEGGATSHYLCAGYIISSGSASTFHVDLTSEPDSTGFIYIKNNGAKPAAVDMMGERVLGTYNGGNMIVKGREKARTWTLLSEPLGVGESSMKVIHDVSQMGWKVGDRIGVAPTEHGSAGKASTFIISAITNSFTIELSHPNSNDKPYGSAFINGQSSSPPVLKAAEVVNLSRNILITGDDFEHIPCDPSITSSSETSSVGCKCSATRTKCTVGLHTIHHSHPSPSPGTMQISNTKVEKCGQRGIEGKYCLHFHKSGDCPQCVFEKNAVEFGHHRGITVHGTHRSTVTHNVVWDVRGANYYVEDGNEMHNELAFNVAACPHSLPDPIMQGCSIPGTSSPGADAPNAAFYSRAATNDWIGNRAANTYNGMLLDAGTRGAAIGKVCYSDAALGRWVGNVMHGCSRFGLYTLGHGGNFPKLTDQSIATNGFNQNFALCEGFDLSESINPGTTDRGYPGAFYQNVDYQNVFVGHYMAGDLQHRAHSSINNNNLIYWKETKNFADGCASHFYDSFYQDGNMALPDQGAIVISKTKMKNVHLEANHHCDVGSTGVLCMPTYIMDETIWEGSSNNKWVSFQAGYNNDGGIFSLAPGRFENGFFPQGFRSLAGATYTYLLASPGPRKCIDSSAIYGNRYDNGILCNADLRSFKIYSRGLTEATALTLKIEVWFNSLGLSGQNGPPNAEQLVGFHIIGGAESTSVKQGYSFPIMAGLTQSYKIFLYDEAAGTSHSIPSDWVIEFSDPVVGNRFGVDDEVYVNVVGRTCGTNGNGLITSQHDRRLLWSGDHFIDSQAWGSHGACTDSPDMFPIDCGVGEAGSIPPSECPELCASSPCNANSYCHCGMPATCKCKPGYTGSDCSVSVCAPAGCGEHGSCIATHLGGAGDVNLSVACVCEEGWHGATCELNPCEAGETAKTCSGNGKCLSQNGVDTECQCDPGYLGDDCEVLNLAYGKVSSTSSELQPSARAFDGVMGSRWESVHGIDDVFLQVDLGDLFNIDEVTIYWETSAATKYDIELSNDGVTFVQVWSKLDGYAGMGAVTSALNGEVARYVRMHAFERAIIYGYSIFEMQVFGSQGPSSAPTPYPTYEIITLAPTVSSSPTSLSPTSSPTIINVLISQGKASSASSENWAGSAASKAFDGDSGSRWESVHGVDDVWLLVDLGGMYAISKVVIDWEIAAAKGYDIEVSSDGVSFTSVWTKNDGSAGMGSVESVLGNGVTGRFVRMHAFERATIYGYSIWEMKVYGFSPCGGCGDHGSCIRTGETEYKCKCDTDWSGESCENTCAGFCLGAYPYGCNPNLGPEIVKYGCLSNGGCSYLTAGNEFSAGVCTFKEVVNEYTTLPPTPGPTPTPNPVIQPTGSKHSGADGCPASGTAHLEVCVDDTEVLAVNCCSGSLESTLSCSRPGCVEGQKMTFAEAVARCESASMRLCTVAELNSDACCFKGCQFDNDMGWSADSCGTALTSAPTNAPTNLPTAQPSRAPTTNAPTSLPTNAPSSPAPSPPPSNAPTSLPTNVPSPAPSSPPSNAPTSLPTNAPSPAPSPPPTNAPTSLPTNVPSPAPSSPPTNAPTSLPTNAPSPAPSPPPSNAPTSLPTTSSPTKVPTGSPTSLPTPAATIDKYICTKNEPLDSTICADGQLADGSCSTAGQTDGCGKGGKTCWWASCPTNADTPAPGPTTPSPTTTPGSCPVCVSTNAQCCAPKTCVDSGKPSNRGCK